MSKTKKVRKNSGRVIGDSTLLREMKKKDIIAQCLEPQEFWNDWTDYRDGFRSPIDKTQIRNENAYFGEDKKTMNKKLKLKEKIRKARKHSN